MKTVLAFFASLLPLVTAGVARAQQGCTCPDETQWSADIVLRESALRAVLATDNKAAILAVLNLTQSAELSLMTNALGSSGGGTNCSKMLAALAEESKVERQMIQDHNSAPSRQK